MKESRFCRVFKFLADTPKSAARQKSQIEYSMDIPPPTALGVNSERHIPNQLTDAVFYLAIWRSLQSYILLSGCTETCIFLLANERIN